MIPNFLKDKIKDFTAAPRDPSRDKLRLASRHGGKGRMWEGGAIASYGHMKFLLELFCHGGANETCDGLKHNLTVDSIVGPTGSLKVAWQCLLTDEGVWYHRDGWATDVTLANHPLIRRRKNYRIQLESFTKEQERELLDLGFMFLGKSTCPMESRDDTEQQLTCCACQARKCTG